MAKKKSSQGPEHDLLRIASFMLFDAMLFHLVLSNGRPTVHDFDKRGSESWKRFLRKQWLHIRTDINYRPVFDLALDILDALPPAPDTEQILSILARAAEDAVASGILLKHDFVGRIYHKLLLSTTGHYYATYYTSLPAAWLLSGLTLRAPHPSWKFDALENLGAFSVIDPACGSGTLLSASYSALRDLYVLNAKKSLDLDTFHQVALSTTLHGWDVLDFAAHLTLTTLALHSDTVTAEHSNIYKMPLGASGSRAQLGSLDYLSKATDLKGMALTEPTEELAFEGSREVELERRSYDVVIMNPPFSRSAKPNVKFGYTDEAARKRMGEALAHLGSDLGLRKAGVAGLTPFFMMLALKMLKANGRTGMVVPRSILSGVGSKDVRKRYEAGTAVQFVVSNFDPGSRSEKIDGWSWSENTDLGEVLIVAQNAKEEAIEVNNVTFVNIVHRPRNEVEALILSQEIVKLLAKKEPLDLVRGNHHAIETRGTLRAFVYTVPQKVLRTNWLAPCTFAAPALNALLMLTLQNQHFDELSKFVKPVDGEFGTGRDIAPIKQNFQQFPVTSDAKMVFGHQADMNTMAMADTHIKNAKGKKNPNSKLMYQKFASTFLLAERPHMKTESLLAMQVRQRVLATAFWEIQLKDALMEPWLIMWFNSSYGLMTFLSYSTSSQGDIFKMKKDQLIFLPVPRIPAAARSDVQQFFDTISTKAFQPYSAEFAQAALGKGSRERLDTYFQKALGLGGLQTEHYEALAADPVIGKTKLQAQ